MNPEEKFNNIIQDARKTALSHEEKERVRLNVVNFMKHNPVKSSAPSFWNSLDIIGMISNRPVLRYSFLLSCLVLFGIGGISIAANRALPGEPLYTVKTQVNEKVLSFITFSEDQKAQYEVGLVQLRLEEFEKITSENKLDDAKIAEVKTLLDGHIKEVNAKLEVIKNKNKADVALQINSQLEGSLNAHAKVLDRLAENKKEKISGTFKNLLADIKDTSNETKQSRISNELKLFQESSQNKKNAAENKLTKTEDRLREIIKLIADKKESIPAGTYQKAQADVELANVLLIDGKAKVEAGEYGQALIVFQNAIRVLQKAKIYLSQSENLKVELNFDTIEDEDKEALENLFKMIK